MSKYFLLIFGLLACETSLFGELPMVTISGELPLNLVVVSGNKRTGPIALTLVHRFVNVGTKYVSYIGIAELESRLIPLEEGHYQWLSSSGRTYSCQIGVPFTDGTNRWILGQVDGSLVLRAFGGRKMYRYQDGLLVEEYTGQTVLRYSYKKGMAERVSSDSGGIEIIRDNFTSKRYTIKLPGGSIQISLNEWGSINECNIDGGQIHWKFCYVGTFLSEVRTETSVRRIRIGDCEFSGDYSRNNVMRPVVLQIDDVRVIIKRGLHEIEGRMENGQSSKLVSWRAVRDGNGFRLSGVSGHAGLILADVDVYIVE